MDVLDDFLDQMTIENTRKKLLSEIGTLARLRFKLEKVLVNENLYDEISRYTKFLDIKLEVENTIETYKIVYREMTLWERIKYKFL